MWKKIITKQNKIPVKQTSKTKRESHKSRYIDSMVKPHTNKPILLQDGGSYGESCQEKFIGFFSSKTKFTSRPTFSNSYNICLIFLLTSNPNLYQILQLITSFLIHYISYYPTLLPLVWPNKKLVWIRMKSKIQLQNQF